MDSVLTAKKLCKIYTNGKSIRSVLNDIHLTIKKTEFVALMGPSGSGKSTLLYNLSGMDRFTSGEVVFNTQELSTLSDSQLSELRLYEMGFVFQQIHLLKNLSIFDNIIFSAYLAKKNTKKHIDAKALSLMKQMNIAVLANNTVTEASGGQLQRAAICRALINDPVIVFGDEPTGALDSKTALDIMDILIELNRGGTALLLATHDIKVSAKADRVIYILDGKIVGEKEMGKFKHTDNNEVRERELSAWLAAIEYNN